VTTLLKVLAFTVIVTLLNTTNSLSVEVSQVTITEDQSVADIFRRYTVTGITTPLPQLPDVPGFVGVSYLTAGDIDEDGVKEIVGASGPGADSDPVTPDGAIALFTSTGPNANNWTQTIINDTFLFPNELELHDVDNDTYLDIVVADHFIYGEDPSGIYYLRNNQGIITDPANWEKRTIYLDTSGDSYHRTRFLDVDGDGDEDIITTKLKYAAAVPEEKRHTMLWLENTGTLPYTAHTIGMAGGTMFNLYDLDNDTDLDIVAIQFAITDGIFSNTVLAGTDGDSVFWFENPGQAAMLANPDLEWSLHTIDNWYTSSNPIGKGFEVIVTDIDNDSDDELVVSTHNHQNYDGQGNRLWPAGIYLFEIPSDPTITASWSPVAIETGDPNLLYDEDVKTTPYLDPDVLADVYAVDRRGDFYNQGSPGMVRAHDLSDEGLPEVVVPGDGKGVLYYYQNDGVTDTTLHARRGTLYYDPQCIPGEANIYDLDDDGHLDIAAVIFDTSVDNPYPYTSSSIFLFSEDNCPTVANTGQEDGDSDNAGDACDNCLAVANPGQDDNYPPGGNGCGDACECEGNFDGDEDQDGTDAATFKIDFGRSPFSSPCATLEPCNGDFDCDVDVDGTDAARFKEDFGRSGFSNPCPTCITGDWCSYTES
jgi:hypothetical protein